MTRKSLPPPRSTQLVIPFKTGLASALTEPSPIYPTHLPNLLGPITCTLDSHQNHLRAWEVYAQRQLDPHPGTWIDAGRDKAFQKIPPPGGDKNLRAMCATHWHYHLQEFQLT